MTEQERAALIQANRIDPKQLYVTPHQAELWRQVFLRHSPIHTKREFVRIYQEAFARVTDRLPLEKIALVGLGCGTGMKERDLLAVLIAKGHAVQFSAIDVSADLVAESMHKLVESGAEEGRTLVCDLANMDFIADWLLSTTGNLPRLLTFFGLVPNLAPAVVARLFRAVLRQGDVLLVSVHLAESMEAVLPQYDNAETKAWLAAGLDEVGLTDLTDDPQITIGEVDGIPAFLGTARWKDNARAPFQLFHSLRYTPELFEDVMNREGLQVERLAITACRQEAIWAVG